MKAKRTQPSHHAELDAIRHELSHIKGLLVALLVILAMGTFLPEGVLGAISLLVLLLALGYLILLPLDRLYKRKLAKCDQEIERKVLAGVDAPSSHRREL